MRPVFRHRIANLGDRIFQSGTAQLLLQNSDTSCAQINSDIFVSASIDVHAQDVAIARAEIQHSLPGKIPHPTLLQFNRLFK